ncbi:MAG: leucine-rich repeat protein [Bacteroidales bacterium]|nr:leucine-rich repeat protein [Bacteroidales bacterium]
MKHNIFFKALVLALLVAGGISVYGQHIVYEPYDFRQANADGDTLYYRITSAVEPYTVAVTRCHDSIYHQLPHASYAWEVGQPGFAYPVYDYDSLINIPPAVTYDNVTYTVTAIDIEAFYYQKGLRVVNLPSTIETIDTAAFYLSTLSEITLQEGLERIDYGAFASCYLTQIDLPSSTLNIGELAFDGCYLLTRINIPEGITKIPAYCFQSCFSLNDVVLPESVDSIEANSFAETDSLTQIVIPSQVRYIGPGAFSHLNNNHTFQITMESTTPPDISDGFWSFQFDTIYCTIPCGTTGVYEAAWSAPGQHFIFTEDCSGIDDIAKQSVKVYPNPASDVIHIEMNTNTNNKIFVYDICGKKVANIESKASSTDINLSSLPQGVYILRIINVSGVYVEKICKK